MVTGVPTTHIVLEYISDPILRDNLKLEVGGLTIHKNWTDALEQYIYSRLIDVKASVPLYEKQRAKKEYKLSSSRAAMREIKYEELIQYARGIV
jgi:hypothetical protein